MNDEDDIEYEPEHRVRIAWSFTDVVVIAVSVFFGLMLFAAVPFVLAFALLFW